MARIKNTGIDCLIEVLKALSDCNCDVVEGSISLNQGSHEITVQTAVAPTAVFLSVVPAGTPVCVGDIDLVGYNLLPDGFILYADIKSNAVEVSYFVE